MNRVLFITVLVVLMMPPMAQAQLEGWRLDNQDAISSTQLSEPILLSELEQKAYGVPPFSGKKIRMNFNSIEIPTALKIIGKFSRRQVDFSGSKERIPLLYEESQPWDKIIYDIANEHGYEFTIEKKKIIFREKNEDAVSQ